MMILSAPPVSASGETVFHLDSPPEGATVAGIVEVSGWILDDGQECGPPPEWQACDWSDALVSTMDLYVDGVLTARVDLNIPRYDVLQAYPWYAGTPFARPGFSTSFDADTLVDGTHGLFLRVAFSDGTTEDHGQRTFVVQGSINQAPFGEIEMPGNYQPMNGVPIRVTLDDGQIEDVGMVDRLVVGRAVTDSLPDHYWFRALDALRRLGRMLLPSDQQRPSSRSTARQRGDPGHRPPLRPDLQRRLQPARRSAASTGRSPTTTYTPPALEPGGDPPPYEDPLW
jgi:hypothetical protein